MLRFSHIIFLFLVQINLSAQNAINVCEGDIGHNFSVPKTIGSNYNWSFNSNIATITSGNGTEHIVVDFNNPGMIWLYVEESDVNLCKGYDSMLIYIHPRPDPFIFNLSSLEFCEGQFVTIGIDSLYDDILWNNGGISQFVDIFESGEYFVVVTDENGCSDSSNILTVVSNYNPDVNFSIDQTCYGNPTNLIDSSYVVNDNIVGWMWDLGDGAYYSGNYVNHIYSSVGFYDVELIVTSSNGCKDSLIKTLEIFNSPEASFTFTPDNASTINPFVQFTNTSVNAIPVVWHFGDSTFSYDVDPYHEFISAGKYVVSLTVTDTNSCLDSTTNMVVVYYDFILYMPTSFTPNLDAKNEYFGPKGLRFDKLISYEFIVYDRWGGIVFKTNDPSMNWNGKSDVSNKFCPPGSYTWVIIINDEVGAKQERSGLVRLIR